MAFTPKRDFEAHIKPKDRRAEIQKWIQNGIDKEAVEFAHEFGKQIAETGLTTSQIRNIFGEMRRIQMKGYISEKTDFILLKPKMAYTAKRNDKKGLYDFFYLFEIGYDCVNTNNDPQGKQQFENLMNLLEAVLAYHKFHGGRE